VTVRLRPLRPDEYPAFVEVSRREYADDLHRNGGLTREAAEAKAGRDFAELLSDGLDTPGHTMTAIELEADGTRIGRLWFARRELNGRTVAYLYDVSIDQAHRGAGLGRAAMVAYEETAREQGFERLELNVFGGNERARGLYRSLGFAETAVNMAKQLKPESRRHTEP
jgi:ribosomal protein S18 acetylase RimI-like enzyme